jgi:ligand-binding sensor domain-containing protein/signal transduction histidine kinase
VAIFRWLRAAACLWLAHLCLQVSAAVPAALTSRAYAFRVWETDHGLPNNSVMSLVQTRDGYLWLGTLDGLVRFDGLRFKVFNTANTPGLPENRILYLYEDNQRRLWIGTDSAGVVFMHDGRITAPPALAGGGPERRLRGACEDGTGAIWLLRANGDLWRFADGAPAPFVPPGGSGIAQSIIKEVNGPVRVAMQKLQFAIGPAAETGSLELPLLGEPRTFALLDMLVASPRVGYWRLSVPHVQRVTNGIERTVVTPYPWLREAAAACEDHEGNLVVGTLGTGIFILSPAGEVTALSTAQGLSHSRVRSLLVDRDGTLWAGTDGGGLNRITLQTFKTVESTRNWSIESVTEDAQGALVLGTTLDGLVIWRGATPQQHFIAGHAYTAVRAVSDGSLWFASAETLTRPVELLRIQNSVVYPRLGAGLIEHRVRAIHEDRAGRMWFGTAGGLVRFERGEWKKFTTRDGLSGNGITALADDPAGNLWIGTERSGLNRFSGGTFTTWRQSEGAPSDEVAALWADDEGTVWVTSSANGLGRFRDGRWTRFTTREGLASDNLGYIIEDEGENFWIASNAGVLRVPKRELNDFAEGRRTFVSSRAFDQNDGLPTRSRPHHSQPAAWRGTNGTLWFATTKGVAAAIPSLVRLNTNPPPVTIESVTVDDTARRPEPFEGGSAIVLHPADERVEIAYSSLNLGAAERARFRYKLAGYEKDWFDAGGERSAVYRKLGAGRYRFQVLAANEDGVWNETGASLAIVVKPPFWSTWWFIAAVSLVTLGVSAAIVHYLSTQKLQRQLAVMRQQEALERERARIARDIHDQVGASLTQVALLGELVETDKDLPQEVEAHAQQISQTARETTRALDEIVWTVNPANDTLEGLVNYICKHAQDFLGIAGLRYRLEIPDVPDASIPPDVRHNVFLASKEAVTNIVRHAKATSVWLRMRLAPDSFVVEIEDNGRGIADPDAPSVRNGLKNMRKRMEDVGGRCEFLRGSEGGALVRLTVPLGKAKVAATTATR